MKKKMAVTITELEMSLDAANKGNAQLQGTCKQQQAKIMELTSAFDDTQRKLVSSVEQYETVIKKLQIVEQELNVAKTNLNAAMNDKRGSDARINELTDKITEISNVNNSLQQVKKKESSSSWIWLIRDPERLTTFAMNTMKGTLMEIKNKKVDLPCLYKSYGLTSETTYINFDFEPVYDY